MATDTNYRYTILSLGKLIIRVKEEFLYVVLCTSESDVR